LRFLVVFLSPSRRMPDSTLKLGHDGFLPNPFQFIIIHLSSYHWRYILYLYWKSRKMNYQLLFLKHIRWGTVVKIRQWQLYHLYNYLSPMGPTPFTKQ
jgi:hypothetical protein